MDLSIVIISWNTAHLTLACLDSILKSKHSFSYEIIVVDNASIDESVELIKASYPQVHLILNESNLGFAEANNQAFAVATGEFILMLNSDTIVHSDGIEKCFDFLRNNLEVGCLTPLVLNEDGSIQHYPYLKDPSMLGEALQNLVIRQFLKLIPIKVPQTEVTCNVKHACGCSLFLRKIALDEIGLLDDQLSFSFEDVDICIRVRKHGWKVIFYPEARITHFGGKSRVNNPSIIQKMMTSKYHFFKKHHGQFYCGVVALITIINSLSYILFYWALSIFGYKKWLQQKDFQFHKSIFSWHFKNSK